MDNHIQNPSFNRTFMELKFISCFLVCSPIGVLIVPLWNWNYGWHRRVLGGTGFNRTFMELKSTSDISTLKKKVEVLIVPLWNWNYSTLSLFSLLINVLIVPLWNWNDEESNKLSKRVCFNRTFMELKSIQSAQRIKNHMF